MIINIQLTSEQYDFLLQHLDERIRNNHSEPMFEAIIAEMDRGFKEWQKEQIRVCYDCKKPMDGLPGRFAMIVIRYVTMRNMRRTLMKIKKLEWEERTKGFWWTKFNGISFSIFEAEGYYGITSNRLPSQGGFNSLQEAKDAAQEALKNYAEGFCEPDPPDSQIEALIRENFELKKELEAAERHLIIRAEEIDRLGGLLAEAEEKIVELNDTLVDMVGEEYCEILRQNHEIS